MSVVENIFETRSGSFSSDDISLRVVEILGELFDIDATRYQTEVYIKEEDVRGRANTVVQDEIGIETKSDLNKDRQQREALKQVNDILVDLEEDNTTPVGIATDGVEWQFYILVKGEPYEYYSFSLERPVEDDELKEYLWTALTPLRQESHRPDPSAEAVAEAFRPNGPAFNEITPQLLEEMEDIVDDEPLEFTSKFIPWFEVFSYVYNDFGDKCKNLSGRADEYQPIVEELKQKEQFGDTDQKTLEGAVELFARHTYLAVLAKCLSALVTLGDEAVMQYQLSAPEELLTGKSIRERVAIGDPNDYFSWIGAGSNQDKIASSVLRVLRRFSTKYTDDVFRHLYEQVVDSDTRHGIGEFFTPKWMAQLITENNIESAHQSVIDPACGSGTFLVFAFKRKMALKREDSGELSKDDVDALLDQVWGIDINPLSVLLAKTNMYLVLTSSVDSRMFPDKIKLNVITADTFIFPRYTQSQRQLSADEGDDQPLVSVEITERISVPVHPELDVDTAQAIIERCGEYMEVGREEVPENEELEGALGEYQTAILQTMSELRNRYGGILWKYILRNYGIPPLLAGDFDVVIGNPPWLLYREAHGDIKKIMNDVADEYGIKPPVQGKTSFNLSIPFFLASTNLLGNRGTISFVLPLSVLDGVAHAPFIDKLLEEDHYKIKNIYDAEDITPNPFPHTLPSAIVSVKIHEEERHGCDKP